MNRILGRSFLLLIGVSMIVVVSCGKTKQEVIASKEDTLLYNRYLDLIRISVLNPFNKCNYDSVVHYYALQEQLTERGLNLNNYSVEESLFILMLDSLVNNDKSSYAKRFAIIQSLEKVIHYNASFSEYVMQVYWVKWTKPDEKFIEAIRILPDSNRFEFIERTMAPDVDSQEINEINKVILDFNVSNDAKAKKVESIVNRSLK